MKTSATPEGLEHYFQSFATYLQSGETAHLAAVFPAAENLPAAAVYRNGFLRGCIEALRSSYPVVEMLVGKDYFDHLADTYVALYPPQRSTFIDYGEYFPEFLLQKLEQHKLAYLPDFARLDQACAPISRRTQHCSARTISSCGRIQATPLKICLPVYPHLRNY